MQLAHQRRAVSHQCNTERIDHVIGQLSIRTRTTELDRQGYRPPVVGAVCDKTGRQGNAAQTNLLP